MPDALKAATLGCALAALIATDASAVITQRLKQACRQEYFAYCSAHPLGSAALRECMRAAQDRLSDGCLRELVTAGEVTEQDIKLYKGRKRR